MNPNYFRALGVVTLFANIFLLPVHMFLGMNPQATQRLVASSVVSVVAVGLVLLRKWAALYFSIPLFGFGIWFALTAIGEVPFPFNLLAMCKGVSYMLPLVVTIKVWRQLTWGGKWFF